MDPGWEIALCIVVPIVVAGLVLIIVAFYGIVLLIRIFAHRKTKDRLNKQLESSIFLSFCVQHFCSLDFFLHLLGCMAFFLELSSLILLIVTFASSFWGIIFFVFAFIAIAFVILQNIPIFGYFFTLAVTHYAEKIWEKNSRAIKLINLSVFSFFYFANGVIDGGVFAMVVESSPLGLGPDRFWWMLMALFLLIFGIIGFSFFFFFCFADWIATKLKLNKTRYILVTHALLAVLVLYIFLDILALVICCVFSYLEGVRIDSVVLTALLILDVPLRIIEFIVAFFKDRAKNKDLFLF